MPLSFVILPKLSWFGGQGVFYSLSFLYFFNSCRAQITSPRLLERHCQLHGGDVGSAVCSSCSEPAGHSWAPKVRRAAGRAAPPPCCLPQPLALITESSTFTLCALVFKSCFENGSICAFFALSRSGTWCVLILGAQGSGRQRGCSWRCTFALGKRVDMEV